MPPAKKAEPKQEQQPQAAEAALRYEEEIRKEADGIWGSAEYLTPALYRKLQPLLERPIPPAFIEEVPAQKGKPYKSIGVRSVQVQIDRLNHVLGPTHWRDNFTYHQEGRLCHVVVSVLGEPVQPPEPAVNARAKADREILVMRSSYGGVEHGSTAGNIHKGSYTNAAKVAIARLGPGHEIYCGVPDLDPDVSIELAAAASVEKPKKTDAKKVSEKEVEDLRKLWKKSGVDEASWKTFLASRRKKDVTDFDTDDMQAAVSFLSAHESE